MFLHRAPGFRVITFTNLDFFSGFALGEIPVLPERSDLVSPPSGTDGCDDAVRFVLCSSVRAHHRDGGFGVLLLSSSLQSQSPER